MIDDATRKRLRQALAFKGIGMKAASLAAGLGETYARDVVEPTRGRGKLEFLERLCGANGISLEWVRHGRGKVDAPVVWYAPLPPRKRKVLDMNKAPKPQSSIVTIDAEKLEAVLLEVFLEYGEERGDALELIQTVLAAVRAPESPEPPARQKPSMARLKSVIQRSARE